MPPPSTPSPNRFLHTQRSRKPSPATHARPSSALRNESLPHDQAIESPPPPSQVQFAPTPRFARANPRSRPDADGFADAVSAPPRDTRPSKRLRQALLGSHPRREDVQDEGDDDSDQVSATRNALTTTEDSNWSTDLALSPKRRRIDDSIPLSSTQDHEADRNVFARPREPASANRPPPASTAAPTSTAASSKAAPRFLPQPRGLAPPSQSSSAAPRPPFLLRPSPAPPDPSSEPLPDAFSPHRRSGAKFLPGGLAAALQQSVLETGQAAAHARRANVYRVDGGDFAMTFAVRAPGVVRTSGPLILRARDERGAEVGLVLTGEGGERGGRAELAAGRGEGDVRVGLSEPCWSVTTETGRWVVAVDWKCIS